MEQSKRLVPMSALGRKLLFDYMEFDTFECPDDSSFLQEDFINFIDKENRCVSVTDNNNFTDDINFNIDRNGFPIKDLVLVVSGKCNLRCKYCILMEPITSYTVGAMTFDVAKKAIDSLLVTNNGSKPCITFFGGEPLLNFSLIKNILSYYDSQLNYRLLTNMTIMNAEIAELLKNKKVRIQVSLDGQMDAHDKNRTNSLGWGTYKSILENINTWFFDYMDFITIRATMTKGNLDASLIYNHFESLGFKSIIVSHGNGTNAACNYNSDDFDQIKSGYKSLALTYLRKTIEKQTIDAIGAPYNEYIKTLISGKRKENYCGAMRNFYSISPNGDYLVCHDLIGQKDAIIGHVDGRIDQDLITSINNRRQYGITCRNCWAKYFCGGGCYALALQENKAWDIPYENDCILIRWNVQLAIELIYEVFKQSPLSIIRSGNVATILGGSYE